MRTNFNCKKKKICHNGPNCGMFSQEKLSQKKLQALPAPERDLKETLVPRSRTSMTVFSNRKKRWEKVKQPSKGRRKMRLV